MGSRETPSPPLLAHVFPTFAVGGSQIRFAALANGLRSKHRHCVIALNGDFSCAAHLDPAVTVALRSVTLAKGGLGLRNFPIIRRLLGAMRPDLLITYNWGAIEFALANRFAPLAPHLHLEDGFGRDETLQTQLARRVWTRRLALSGRHSRVAAPSHGLEATAKQTWKVAADRVRYIPNGVEVARFAPPPQKPPRANGNLQVVWVGAMRPEKNLSLLLQAVAALDQVDLTLVGDGPERGATAAEVERLNLSRRVRFAGASSAPEHALWAADVFALPSLTEQMPLSLMEAMAAGLAVVATDVGDVGDMLPPEARAFVTPANDLPAFRAALAGLAQDPALRASLGRANQARAIQRFDRALMIGRYDALFDELLASGRTDGGAGRRG